MRQKSSKKWKKFSLNARKHIDWLVWANILPVLAGKNKSKAMIPNVCEAPTGVVEEFPQAAKNYLKAFYDARGVNLGDHSWENKSTPRLVMDWPDAIIAADQSVSNDEEELRILEFYVLTKQRIIWHFSSGGIVSPLMNLQKLVKRLIVWVIWRMINAKKHLQIFLKNALMAHSIRSVQQFLEDKAKESIGISIMMASSEDI